MSVFRSRIRRAGRLRLALAGVILCCALTASSSPPTFVTRGPTLEAPAEIRALWVLRTSLSTPASIAALVRSAREHGFNTLLVQVRGRGDAYYIGGPEPRAAELQRQPSGFDPLATVLDAAHASGLRVHAWVNVNLVSSAADVPIAREHLVHRHPDWLMVPRDIAQELAAIAPDSPAYVGKLARWTRAQTGEIEGLYSSPVVPRAVAHTVALVRGLTRRYALDGVHFDYARYPSERFDYSRAAIREFRASIRPGLAPEVRRELDTREPTDLFAYPDGMPAEWRAFRIARMTELVSRLAAAVKQERPVVTVSVAAAPDIREAHDRRLQDWRAWLERGLVDAVCPMAYTPEAARFAEQIAAAGQVVGGQAIWAGIGAYRLTPAQTIDNIQTARRLGAGGIILFSYDSMTDPRQSAADYLGLVSRAAFASAPDPGFR
ncbi:MAG: family 10 glycosylhydrolase [Acidobacteria bacterium]|nr:family 10 glycosylhydrolase [Acidobacteriota bacterium]MCA1650188.1 family 10 glycosylhydrolase [Acidobacteriota bacterium]